MTREEKIEKLRLQLLSRLDEDIVEYNGEELSFYDVVTACDQELSLYNKFFKEETKAICNNINVKSRFYNLFKRDVPYIEKIVPGVYLGKSIVDVYLIDKDGNKAGVIEERRNEVRFEDFDEIRFSSKENAAFIKDIRLALNDTFTLLDHFKGNHKEFDYCWDFDDKDPQKKLIVDDGFISGIIYLNDVGRSCIGLSNMNDVAVATTRSKKNGIIYDYVEFYNEAFQKRLKVNINDLNPLYREFVNKHVGLEDNKKLTLEK